MALKHGKAIYGESGSDIFLKGGIVYYNHGMCEDDSYTAVVSDEQITETAVEEKKEIISDDPLYDALKFNTSEYVQT